MGSNRHHPRWRQLSLALVAPIVIAAAPTYDAGTRNDVRCIISLDFWAIYALSEDDEQTARIAIAAKHYYIGRVDSVAPTLNLDQAVRGEYGSMAEGTYGSLSNGIAKPEPNATFEAELLERAKICAKDFAKRGEIWLDTMDALFKDAS